MAGSAGIAESKPHLRIVSAAERPEEDDALLVARVRAKEPAAAGRIWDRYAFLVRRLLRRMLGPVDVEDCVQDAFLRLFRDLGSLREPAALRGFLLGITIHVAHSELRKRRAKRWLLLSDDGALLEPESAVSVDWHEPRAAVLRLYQILDRVSDKLRTVFVLRYIEGLELSELATLLGCSLATVKRRVADASSRVCLLAASDPLLAPYLEGRS
ncbi:MAG TPA: RNA polymerase sigma factor [Polyangiaceae bacterium]|jgi:RNA polymerase sigma-70 factor (ECF subfamily)|nr:RNA polymerase sigma factor [Polyangiaceae bacterium]